MKTLNLYAGIGGNRALWPDDAEVTAVELDHDIAEAYRTLWPHDTVIEADAHQYLLEHIADGWDFIWSSPPCQTHSKLNRFMVGRSEKYRYPSLDQLYGEIILLRSYAKCPWTIENVIPYYPPLIPPTALLDRHYVWSNVAIPSVGAGEMGTPKIARDRKSPKSSRPLGRMEIGEAETFAAIYGVSLPPCADHWGRTKRRQVMRNCVDPRLGLAVWNAVTGKPQAAQATLFDTEVTTP